MPPTPQSPPITSRQRLPYNPHSTYSTRALTTGDVSHAHPLRHTQPRTLFISHSHCLSTSRPQIGSNRFHQLLQGMAWGREQGSEGVREGEGKERRLRGKDDTHVTFSCLLSFHIQMHWLVRYSNMVSKASEGRRACGGWWYTSYDMEISFLIYSI